MIKKIVDVIINKQLTNGLMKKEDISVYQYGYTLMIELLINIIIAVLIGFITKEIMIVSIFLIVFIPLRSYAGGYHADKAWKCVILSNSAILFVIWLTQLISDFGIRIELIMIMELFLITLISKNAPVQSINKRLDSSEAAYYKKLVFVILLVELFIEIIMYFIGYRKITDVIAITHVIVTISLYAGKYLEKKNINFSKEELLG